MHFIRGFGVSLFMVTMVVLSAFRISNASILNASVSEQATASAHQLTPPSPLQTDSHSNVTLPPIDVSANAVSGSSSSASGVSISSYIGPNSPVDITTGLTIAGDTTATSFASTGGVAPASASITYNFSLDGAQTYNFGRSDVSVTLIGPTGPVAQGPGTLLPGDYTLTASSSSSGLSDTEGNSFSLVVHVPEPASLALIGFGAAVLLRRRGAYCSV